MTLSRDSLLRHLTSLPRLAASPRFISWINVTLVLLLAYTLAGISWRLWPQSPESHQLLPDALFNANSSSAAGNILNLDHVAAMHLFGESAAVPEQPAQAIIDAPETRLSLTLRGILATSTEGEGRALIAAGSTEEKVYRVGDSISGGAMLHEVLVDKVILKRGGRFETLTLPRERIELGSEGASPTVSNSGAESRRPNPRAGGAMSRQLSEFRQQVSKDPHLALNLMQVQPVMENGAIKGYRVAPGKQRRLFHGTGLRAGDVVTSVNGIALSDPAKLSDLYTTLKSASRLDVMVERGGRPTNLTIDFGN